jgi:hypothetical protein
MHGRMRAGIVKREQGQQQEMALATNEPVSGRKPMALFQSDTASTLNTRLTTRL